MDCFPEAILLLYWHGEAENNPTNNECPILPMPSPPLLTQSTILTAGGTSVEPRFCFLSTEGRVLSVPQKGYAGKARTTAHLKTPEEAS